MIVVPKPENSEAQPTRGVILTQDPNTHQEDKQPGQPNAKVNVSDNVRGSKKWKYGIGVLCVLVVIGLWRGCSERALEKKSINEMQQQWDETTTEINRIKKDDIAARAAKRSIAKKPSAAKPLKSMTIGQVRQLVLDWGYGKLPEQQVEGADEIRKELEVLEKQFTEQKLKDENRLDLLREQIPSVQEMVFLHIDQKREQLTKWNRSQYVTGEITKEEKARLITELQNKQARLIQECEEQRKAAQEEYAIIREQLGVQQREFYQKNILPLRKQLEPDKSVKTFYKVFGKPKDKSLIGDNYYFQYRCKDGIVLLEINAHYFDNDKVLIQSVSVL